MFQRCDRDRHLMGDLDEEWQMQLASLEPPRDSSSDEDWDATEMEDGQQESDSEMGEDEDDDHSATSVDSADGSGTTDINDCRDICRLLGLREYSSLTENYLQAPAPPPGGIARGAPWTDAAISDALEHIQSALVPRTSLSPLSVLEIMLFDRQRALLANSSGDGCPGNRFSGKIDIPKVVAVRGVDTITGHENVLYLRGEITYAHAVGSATDGALELDTVFLVVERYAQNDRIHRRAVADVIPYLVQVHEEGTLAGWPVKGVCAVVTDGLEHEFLRIKDGVLAMTRPLRAGADQDQIYSLMDGLLRGEV